MAFLDGFSYTKALRIEILGIDVTKDLSTVNGIEQLLDFPTPTQFVADDVEIVLADVNSRYNPQRPDNFFARAAAKINGQPLTNDRGGVVDDSDEFSDIDAFIFSGSGINWSRYRDEHGNYVGAIPKRQWRDGYYAPVDIFFARADSGDDLAVDDSDKIFSGVVIDIDYMSDPPTTRIIVSDYSQFLRRAQIKDFGIERALRPLQHLDFRIQDGVYFIPGGHISEDSVLENSDTPFYVNNGQPVKLKYVKEKGLAGSAEFNSFTLDLQRGLLTGGARDFPQHPNVRFKQAYRYKTVASIVKELVEKYVDSGAPSDIRIPEIYFDDLVYQSNGNLSYFLEGHAVSGFPTGSTQYNQWHYSTPTKFGFSASAGDKGRFYFEYRGGNYHYDVATDTFDNTSDSPTYATGDPSNARFQNGHLWVGGRDHGLCWRSVLGDPLDFTEHFYGMHVNHIAGTYVVQSRIDGETEYHIIAGYGALQDTTAGFIGTDEDRGRLDFANGHILLNWQWITLSRRCNQKLPLLETNGRTAWDILEDLARLTNCVIGFEPVEGAGKSRFFFRPADNVVGDFSEFTSGGNTETQSVDATETSTLILENADNFPSGGGQLLAVSQPGAEQQESVEILSYSGKSGTRQLTDLTRGEEGTVAQRLNYPTRVYLIQGVIRNDTTERKGNLLDVNIDANFQYLANDIRVVYGGSEVYPIANEDSVKGYGEHFANFNFPMLDFHQGDWAKWIGDGYLSDYSKANYYVNAVITLNPDVAVGDTVVIFQQERAHLSPVGCRVMRVFHDYGNSKTEIAALTVFRHSRITAQDRRDSVFDPIAADDLTLSDPPNLLWVAGGYFSEVLPPADGGREPLGYTVEYEGSMDLPEGFMFVPGTRQLLTVAHSSGFGPSVGTHSFTYKVMDTSDPAQEVEGEFDVVVEAVTDCSALTSDETNLYVMDNGAEVCKVYALGGESPGRATDMDGSLMDIAVGRSDIIDMAVVGSSMHFLSSTGAIYVQNGQAIGAAIATSIPSTAELMGIVDHNSGFAVFDNTTGKLLDSGGGDVWQLGMRSSGEGSKVVGIEKVDNQVYVLFEDSDTILASDQWVVSGSVNDTPAITDHNWSQSVPMVRGGAGWTGLAWTGTYMYVAKRGATRAIAMDLQGDRFPDKDTVF